MEGWDILRKRLDGIYDDLFNGRIKVDERGDLRETLMALTEVMRMALDGVVVISDNLVTLLPEGPDNDD